jgi:hypothetical protein
MTNKLLLIIFFSMLFLSSCVNNNEEPKIDCSTSDISLSIESFVKAGCVTPGSVILSASGGTGDYTYSLNGVDFSASSSFENLSAGDLTFFVKDNDCTSSVSFTLEGDNAISISVEVETDCDSETGSITVNASGGSGSFMYSIDGGQSQSSNTFSALSSGVYSVEVTNGGQCSASQSVTINAIVSLSNHIAPIISANCAISGCHNGSQSPNLSSKSSIIDKAARIKARTSDRSMPRGRTLTEEQIDQIACWVDAGAKNN